MLMVIFGAGASFDSVQEDPPLQRDSPHRKELEAARPPLAAELFQARFGPIIDKHPDCRALFGRLRGTAIGIEQELERIYEEAADNPDLHRQLMSLRHYIADAVHWCEHRWWPYHHGVTNYSTLLEQLALWIHRERQRVCLVTFNYDTLIEAACRSALDIRFRSLQQYTARPDFSLLKVHGSTNWWRLAELPEGQDALPLHNAVLSEQYVASELTDSYLINPEASYRSPPARPSLQHVWVPAVSVPTVSKNSFECPSEWINILKVIIPQVTKLLVVGWRGADRHFLRLWAEAVPDGPLLDRICVVGTKGGTDQVFNNMRMGGSLRWRDGRSSTEGFSGFVSSPALGSFLYDPVAQ